MSSFLVDGGRFVTFDDSQIGGGHAEIDLGGAVVVSAFADCHLHLTDTGYVTGPRDFSGVRCRRDFEEALESLPATGFVFAGNYDDSTWIDGAAPSARALEGRLADAYAMLVRIDGHSCLVNRKALAWLRLDPAVDGIERDPDGSPTGRLFHAANRAAQRRFVSAIPLHERRAAEERATRVALSEGALHLHVQLVGFGGRDGYAAEIAALSERPPAKWYPKICEPDPALAVALGLPFVGGDVFLDGSIGSATAALCEPYADRATGAPASGSLTYDDEAVAAYFAEAERRGISAGVHAIGDRAIEQCIAGWERVLRGRPSPRNRHFIEHFEVASEDQIRRCARLGLFLSVQPQFDALWGGDGGMYARRLGATRAKTMNAFRSVLDAGATLCGGDDSPVCRLSPLAGMAAACAHHNAAQRLQPLEALTMYTYDAARLGHAETHTGVLAAGYDADFVVLDGDPFTGGSFDRVRVLSTWSNGECVYSG